MRCAILAAMIREKAGALTLDTEKYLQLLKDNKVKGPLFQQTNYLTEQEKKA